MNRWCVLAAALCLAAVGADDPKKATAPAKKAEPSPAEAAAAKYLEAWAKTERAALGMTTAHAAAHRRSAHARLVAKLTRDYEVTEAQLAAAVRKLRADRAAAAVLPPGSLVAVSLEAMEEADARARAKDNQGLRRMGVDGVAFRLRAPVTVRVLGVVDRRNGAGSLPDLAKVLVLDGPDAGKEWYCYPGRVGIRDGLRLSPRR